MSPAGAKPVAGGMPAACTNCGATLGGAYCGHCGQRRRGRLHAGEILGEAADLLFSLDSKLWHTVAALFRRPGEVAREYIAGRRARYVNPFKYCLVMVAGYLLIGAILGADPSERLRVSFTRGGEVPAWIGEAQVFLRRNLNNVIFFALPIFAGVLRLLFRRAGYNYAEHYAFVLFTMGQVFLVGLLLTPLARWSPSSALAVRWLFHLVFFTWAAMVFYDQRNLGGFLRAVVANVFYVLSIVPVAFAFIAVFAIFLRA